MRFSQFTFNFHVPGLTNPFTEYYSTRRPTPVPETSQVDPRTTTPRHIAPQFPTPSRVQQRISLPPPAKSRKRGWEPAFAEPTHAEMHTSNTMGYLDTPARYRAMEDLADEERVEEDVANGERLFLKDFSFSTLLPIRLLPMPARPSQTAPILHSSLLPHLPAHVRRSWYRRLLQSSTSFWALCLSTLSSTPSRFRALTSPCT